MSEELDLGNEKGIVGIKYIEDLSFRKKFRDENRKINTHNEDEYFWGAIVQLRRGEMRFSQKSTRIYTSFNSDEIA